MKESFFFNFQIEICMHSLRIRNVTYLLCDPGSTLIPAELPDRFAHFCTFSARASCDTSLGKLQVILLYMFSKHSYSWTVKNSWRNTSVYSFSYLPGLPISLCAAFLNLIQKEVKIPQIFVNPFPPQFGTFFCHCNFLCFFLRHSEISEAKTFYDLGWQDKNIYQSL